MWRSPPAALDQVPLPTPFEVCRCQHHVVDEGKRCGQGVAELLFRLLELSSERLCKVGSNTRLVGRTLKAGELPVLLMLMLRKLYQRQLRHPF